MPITHTKGGTTLTGDSIDYFRICSMKAAVGLEVRGIQIMRGPLVWPRVAREFGLPRNKEAVYGWLCLKVAELQAVQEHITTDADGRTRREVGGQDVQ